MLKLALRRGEVWRREEGLPEEERCKLQGLEVGPNPPHCFLVQRTALASSESSAPVRFWTTH